MPPSLQAESELSSTSPSLVSSGLVSLDSSNEPQCKRPLPSFATLNDLFTLALMDCHRVGYRNAAEQFRKVETALLASKKTDQTVDEKLLLNRSIVARKICEYLMNQGKMLDHRMQDFIWDFYQLHQFLFSAQLEFLAQIQRYLESYAGNFVFESNPISFQSDQIMNAAFFCNNKLRDYFVIQTGCTISRCMWPENFYNDTGVQYGPKGSEARNFFEAELTRSEAVSRAHRTTCKGIIKKYLKESPEQLTSASPNRFIEGSEQQILCCLTHTVEQSNKVLVNIVPKRLMDLLSNPEYIGVKDFDPDYLKEFLDASCTVISSNYSALEKVLQGYQDRFHFVTPFLEKLQQYKKNAETLNKLYDGIKSERKKEWKEFSHSFPIESFCILESRLGAEDKSKIQYWVDWIYASFKGDISKDSLSLTDGNIEYLELVTTIKNIMMGRQPSQSITKILSRSDGIDKLDYLLGTLFHAYDQGACFAQEAYRRLKDFFGPLLAQYKSVIPRHILNLYLDDKNLSGKFEEKAPVDLSNSQFNAVGLRCCTNIIVMHLKRNIHLSSGKLFYSSQPIKAGVQSLLFSQTIYYGNESVDCSWEYIVQDNQYTLKQIICTPRTPLMHSFLSRAPIPSVYFNQSYVPSLLNITCSVPGIVLEEKHHCQLSVVKLLLSEQQKNMLDKFKRFPDAQRRQFLHRNPIKIYLTGSAEYICSVILELKEDNVQFEIRGASIQSQVLLVLSLSGKLTGAIKSQLPWLKTLSSITIPSKVGIRQLTSDEVTQFLGGLANYWDPSKLIEINSTVPLDLYARLVLLRKCPNVLVNGQPLVIQVDPEEAADILNKKGDFNFDWREQGDDGQDNNITVADEIRLRSVHLIELLSSSDCNADFIMQHPAFFKFKLRNKPEHFSVQLLMKFFKDDGEMLGDFTGEIIDLLEKNPGLRNYFLLKVAELKNSQEFIQKNDVLFKHCCSGELSVDQLSTLSCLSISKKRARKMYKRNRQAVYTQFSLVHTQVGWDKFKHWFKPMLEEQGKDKVRIQLTGADLLKAVKFGEGALVSQLLLHKKKLIEPILGTCSSLDELNCVLDVCKDHICLYFDDLQTPPILSVRVLFIRLNSPAFKSRLISMATNFPKYALTVLRSKEISLSDIQSFPEFFEAVLQLNQLTSQDVARCIQAGMTDAVLQRCSRDMIAKAVVQVMNESEKKLSDERLVELVLEMNPDALTGKQVAQLFSAYPSYQSVICASPSLCKKIASSDYKIEQLIADMVQKNLISATEKQQNDFISVMNAQPRLASGVKKYLKSLENINLLEKLLQQKALHAWLSNSVFDVHDCMRLLSLNNNIISTAILSEPFISHGGFKNHLRDEFAAACSGHKQKEYLLDIFNKLSEENQSKLKKLLLDQPVNFSVDGLLQYLSSNRNPDSMRGLIFDLIENNPTNENISDYSLIQLAKKKFIAVFDHNHLLKRLFAALNLEAYKKIPVEILQLGLRQQAKDFSPHDINALTQISGLNAELKQYEQAHPGVLAAACDAGLQSGEITPASPLRSLSLFRPYLELSPGDQKANRDVMGRFAAVLNNGLGNK